MWEVIRKRFLSEDEKEKMSIYDSYARGYHSAFEYLEESPDQLDDFVKRVQEKRKPKSTSLGAKSRYAKTNRRM